MLAMAITVILVNVILVKVTLVNIILKLKLQKLIIKRVASFKLSLLLMNDLKRTHTLQLN